MAVHHHPPKHRTIIISADKPDVLLEAWYILILEDLLLTGENPVYRNLRIVVANLREHRLATTKILKVKY